MKRERFEELEKRFIQAFEFAFEYGIKKFESEIPFAGDSEAQHEILKTHSKKYVSYVQAGFKEAQAIILFTVLELQDHVGELKGILTEARVKKEKEKVAKLLKLEKKLSYFIALFEAIADSIYWQLIDRQLYISRLLHADVQGEKLLRQTNIESVLKLVDEINDIPEQFALITDLTSTCQTGDILAVYEKEKHIIEVKEGAKNYEILKVLKDVDDGALSIDQARTKFPDKKSSEQLERNRKQMERGRDTCSILRKDYGVHPTYKVPMLIIEPPSLVADFEEDLVRLATEILEGKPIAYGCIEGCLHILIDARKGHAKGDVELTEMAKKADISNFYISNVLRSIGRLSKPILLFALSKPLIFDLIFQRKSMFFLLDLDAYMSLYTHFKMKADWVSKKETSKLGREIFSVNGRAIRLSYEDGRDWGILTIGAFDRLLYDHFLPSYLAYAHSLIGINVETPTENPAS